jgi:hypothetical protein
LRRRWGGLPRWSRWVLAAYLAGFAEGGCLHLFWLLANGIHTYALFPVPIQVFGLPSITLFGLFAIVTAVPLLRAMDSGRESEKRPVLRSEQ